MDFYQKSLREHKKRKGKLEIKSKFPICTAKDLSTAYTPGVAQPCIEIHKDVQKAFSYTIKANTVAVVSDGSAVLGLGNIGAEAAIPVMEGKCILMKEFAHVDAFPICLKNQEPENIVQTIKNIAPVFGAINLEDIAAPKCFYIEQALQTIGIPVMHDDQHGTATVLLAALLNSSRVTKKRMGDLKVVINGAGAAGTAVAKTLFCKDTVHGCDPVADVILCDSKGVISKQRKDLNVYKKELAKITNKENKIGELKNALVGADVFIGLSVGNLLNESMVKRMNRDPIIFAMANPVPEIMPKIAKAAGASVIGTGRSDFPNQINNVLAFPGIFRGALDAKATKINPEMRLAAALSLAACVKHPKATRILPSPFDRKVPYTIAHAVEKAAIRSGVIRI